MAIDEKDVGEVAKSLKVLLMTLKRKMTKSLRRSSLKKANYLAMLTSLMKN